jgi:hypothetical protein
MHFPWKTDGTIKSFTVMLRAKTTDIVRSVLHFVALGTKMMTRTNFWETIIISKWSLIGRCEIMSRRIWSRCADSVHVDAPTGYNKKLDERKALA